MLNQVLQVLQPVLWTLFLAALSFIGAQVKKVVPYVIEYLIKKIGLTNYQKTKSAAWDIWNIVEEDGRLGQLANSKLDSFATQMKAKYPQITDEEINYFRQAIAGEFNKDKQAIVDSEKQITNTIVIQPTTIYKTPDGKLLQIVDETLKGVPTPGEAVEEPKIAQ